MTLPKRDDIHAVARELFAHMMRGAGGVGPSSGQAAARNGDAAPRRGGALISDKEVRTAKAEGKTSLVVTPGTIVTPLARDAAWECGIELRYEDAASGSPTPAPAGEPAGGPAPIQGGHVALGSDHGGFALKGAIKAHLEQRGVSVVDLGTHSKDACDYPDYAAAVGKAVALGEASWGILVDGAGIGSCMAAGKVPGVLAATCHDVRTAKNSREHNGANVLCLGCVGLADGDALQIVDAWLEMPFAGGRHGRRVNKILAIERSFLSR